MEQPVLSETFLESGSEALQAVATQLAREAPQPATLASALYALANLADGTVALLIAARIAAGPDRPLELDPAGRESLRRAEVAMNRVTALAAADRELPCAGGPLAGHRG